MGFWSKILAFHQTQSGVGTRGSRLKIGAISGAGNNVVNGDQFESFTAHGFGYGLLQADLVEPFLLQYYSFSAHAYTRGTWVCHFKCDSFKGSRVHSIWVYMFVMCVFGLCTDGWVRVCMALLEVKLSIIWGLNVSREFKR